jgi:hypothetical protein
VKVLVLSAVVLLCPPTAVTTTVAGPAVVAVGGVQVRLLVELEATVTLEQGSPPTVTLVTLVKSVPVTVIGLTGVKEPALGLTAVTVGVAT